VISTLCINGFSIIPGFENYFTMYGQVIYPGGSQISIQPNSQLIIELQDISITYDLAKTIARQISDAVVFPIIFDISYTSNEITYGHLHVLNAKIINKYYDVLFVNEKRIEVKLLGTGRTKFIDIPVVPIKQYDLVPPIKLLEWPELVGMNGDEAVDIIKQETGYNQVFIITDGSKVSRDLRYDRVCVFVDKNGKVSHVPRTG